MSSPSQNLFHNPEGRDFQIIILEDLEIPDAEFIYVEDLFDDPDDIFQKLLDEIPWQQEESKMMGKTFPQPRKTCLIGDLDKPYFYSGFKRKVFPITPTIRMLMDEVQKIVNLLYPDHPIYTSVLCNYYENGKSYIAYHSDDEKDLVEGAIISSLSFGAERFFDIRRKKTSEEKEKLQKRVSLKNGSWLGMGKNSQKNYKHGLPKQKTIKHGRINLTFRVIKNSS